MDGTVGYLVAIIFLVLALNLYFTYKRISKSKRRIKKGRVNLDEEKQAIWRDKEIARRIAREHEDALERVSLRNETLAFYEEVRRRHAGDATQADKENILGAEGISASESNTSTETSD
ncbi:MAG: hypothetical protein FWC20_04750 [Oscillospiraceae bacterium]|nr:hypothetical protein [Oscillospiraceae bacterium]MCL2278702.1 hypothetical protein [Oscillospiraceae bacterium]